MMGFAARILIKRKSGRREGRAKVGREGREGMVCVGGCGSRERKDAGGCGRREVRKSVVERLGGN